jgi:hypothetical protein
MRKTCSYGTLLLISRNSHDHTPYIIKVVLVLRESVISVLVVYLSVESSDNNLLCSMIMVKIHINAGNSYVLLHGNVVAPTVLTSMGLGSGRRTWTHIQRSKT